MAFKEFVLKNNWGGVGVKLAVLDCYTGELGSSPGDFLLKSRDKGNCALLRGSIGYLKITLILYI